MKLIKLAIWVALLVVFAYLLTDFQINGKTIKQNIDDFLQSNQGEQVKKKAKEVLNEKVVPALNEFLSSKDASKLTEEQKKELLKKLEKLEAVDGISDKDAEELKKILEANL